MNTPKKQKQFRRYKNLDGKSTILKYEIAKDGVTLVFNNSTSYRWTNQSAEPANISKMKELALAGKGLDALVNGALKDRWLKKIR